MVQIPEAYNPLQALIATQQYVRNTTNAPMARRRAQAEALYAEQRPDIERAELELRQRQVAAQERLAEAKRRDMLRKEQERASYNQRLAEMMGLSAPIPPLPLSSRLDAVIGGGGAISGQLEPLATLATPEYDQFGDKKGRYLDDAASDASDYGDWLPADYAAQQAAVTQRVAQPNLIQAAQYASLMGRPKQAENLLKMEELRRQKEAGITDPFQTKFREESAKHQAQDVYDMFASYRKEAKNAAGVDKQLQQMESLLNKGVSTGKMQSFLRPIKGWLADTGVLSKEDARSLSRQETFVALGNQLALRLRNPDSGLGLTGNTSDRDVRFLLDSVPNLSSTEEGNKILLKLWRQSNDYTKRKFRFVADLRKRGGGNIPQDIDYRIIEWEDNNPMFTQAEADALKASASKLGIYDARLSAKEMREMRRKSLEGGI